jgi:hypothetical protein
MAYSSADIATLVDNTVMSFDPTDKKNGSMYICDPSKGNAAEPLIKALQAEGLWSADTKTVPDAHKDAYKGQLQFVEAVDATVAGKKLVLLRCDHPKYPSDAQRWEEWKRTALNQK